MAVVQRLLTTQNVGRIAGGLMFTSKSSLEIRDKSNQQPQKHVIEKLIHVPRIVVVKYQIRIALLNTATRAACNHNAAGI